MLSVLTPNGTFSRQRGSVDLIVGLERVHSHMSSLAAASVDDCGEDRQALAAQLQHTANCKGNFELGASHPLPWLKLDHPHFTSAVVRCDLT